MPIFLTSKLVESVLKVILICMISFGLTACSSNEGDDLDQFMHNAANTMSPHIKPLPEVKPYLALQYNADGTLAVVPPAFDDLRYYPAFKNGS